MESSVTPDISLMMIQMPDRAEARKAVSKLLLQVFDK